MTDPQGAVPATAQPASLSIVDVAVLAIAGVAAYFVVVSAAGLIGMIAMVAETNARAPVSSFVYPIIGISLGVALFRLRWSLATRWFGGEHARAVSGTDLVTAQSAVFAVLGVWFMVTNVDYVVRLCLPFAFDADPHASIHRESVVNGIVWLAASALLFFQGRTSARWWNHRSARA